jgi:hypothetical protein
VHGATVMDDQLREDRLRRMAERRHLRLRKAPRRDPRAPDVTGYMLIDADSKAVIVGGEPFPYGASLDEIAKYLVG